MRPEHFHLLRLRPDELPDLVSVPLARQPSGPHHLIDGLDQVTIADPPRPWARAVATAEHRMRAILTYLWDHGPAAALASDALVEHDLQHGGRTVCTGLHLDGTTHYVWTRGTPPSTALPALQDITLITGVCLGSATAVMGITAGGRRMPVIGSCGLGITEDIIALDHDPRPTLPEVDSSVRLIGLCAGVARRIPPAVPVTRRLNSPYLSYPLKGLAAAYAGHLPVPLLAAWFDIAVTRHHPVTRRQIAAARAALACGRPVRIRVVPELWRVALHLRRELASGRLPSFDHLLDEVVLSDRLWRQLIEIARPSSPLELGYLTYVASLVRPAWSTSGRRRLLVQVDDPREWRILDRVRQLAPLLRDSADEPVDVSAVALYPLSRFWIQPPVRPARPDAHGVDPGHLALQDGRRVNLFSLAANMCPTTRMAVTPLSASSGASTSSRHHSAAGGMAPRGRSDKAP
ncbi:hypothetical protein [Nonomuraea turcica]|uniref:hypothetical protein n=1 Tax=Nonomuraea sp. G32 TaxID=3067274 RepID=UPI00273B5A5E|nr:hypothetical protein [Nonomuraea sp. G32]